MAGSKDSNGGWGQHIFQKVLKIIASFSEELLAHRCGISDVVFEEGCVILVKKVASFLTCFCNSRCRGPTCTAMRADPLKLCFSSHWTCKAMSLDALFKLEPDSRRSYLCPFPCAKSFFRNRRNEPDAFHYSASCGRP